jgi:hypothetical protein
MRSGGRGVSINSRSTSADSLCSLALVLPTSQTLPCLQRMASSSDRRRSFLRARRSLPGQYAQPCLAGANGKPSIEGIARATLVSLSVAQIAFSRCGFVRHQQSELQKQLNEIVRGTKQFQIADAQGKFIRLPTGEEPVDFSSTLTSKSQNRA